MERCFGFPVLLACVLALIIFFAIPKTLADPDLGWHLRNTQYQLLHRTILHQDLFSYTTNGKSWLDHEWLSEIPFYLGWKWLGFRGIFLMEFVQIEIIFLGIFGLAYRTCQSSRAAFIVSFLSIFWGSVSFGPRTLLSGWICLISELTILYAFHKGSDLTWGLPPLFLLWVNLHGSWLIGFVLFVLFVLSGLKAGRWGWIESTGWSIAQKKKLASIASLSALALFLNPYGWRLVFYPFDMAFNQKLNIANVEEWRTVDFHSPRGKIVLGILFASILLQMIRPRKWQLHEVLFLLVGIYAGFTYYRFLFLAAILILPFVSRNIADCLPHRTGKDNLWVNAVLITCFLVTIGIEFPGNRQLSQSGSKLYPYQALSYLQTFHPNGRVFNEFRWGGYLIWNTPHIPVFIDSRVDVFEHNGVFADYLHAIRLKDSLPILDRYRIRYVLFERDAPLPYLLEQTRQWRVLYQDNTTVLLERMGGVR